MKTEKLSASVAKSMTNMLTRVLRADANSASCIVFHQPKAPKELERFRRDK